MVVSDFSLQGKVAIVTGGSRGIGRSIALALAEHGANIAIAARQEGPLNAVAEEVRQRGRRALAVPTNIRYLEQLRKLVDCTKAEFGRVDILVNNAAANPAYGPIQELDERTFDVIMSSNVKAPHFLSAYVREAILEHGEGGNIINVSSIGGVRAGDVTGGYSVSKAALIMLTQVCAKNWGSDGIRVNCIAPGLVKTDFARPLWDDEHNLKQAVEGSALERIAEPDEMAGAVVFLASSASSFVTGQTLMIDGGRLI